MKTKISRTVSAQPAFSDQYLIDALLEHIPDNIYFKDRQGRFVKINKSQSLFLGLDSTETAVGKTDFDFFKQEHARQAFLDEQNIIESGKPMLNKEELITTTGGISKWFSVTKAPLYNARGDIIGTFGLSRDITDSKELENEREALITQLKEALEHVQTLKGLIPICSHCKKMRDDQGYWHEVEVYVRDHSSAEFSHGLCEECLARFYPEYFPKPAK
jgi:PAS domain S-box-containing protein